MYSLAFPTNTGVLPWDQLSRKQLPIDQLPTGSAPIKLTSHVNLCMNTCTNEQVHYCFITKAQFGVSLKLNTLQDYFHHSGSVQKACKSYLVRCISSFKGGWVVPAANCSKFISFVACSFLMTSMTSKIFGCGLPTIRFNWECQPSTWVLSAHRNCTAGVWIGHWSKFGQSMWQNHWCCPTLGQLLVELLAMLLEQSWGEQSKWLLSSAQSIWGFHPQICTTLAAQARTFRQIAWE